MVFLSTATAINVFADPVPSSVGSVTTVVGSGTNVINPSGTPTPTAPGTSPGPSIPPGNNSVAGWANTIASSITPLSCSNAQSPICRYNYVYNVQEQNFTNSNGSADKRGGSCCQGGGGYLCTNLVIDSYKLAGLKYMQHQTYVPTMQNNWESDWGGKLYSDNGSNTCHDPGTRNSGESIIKSLSPGDVIFMYSPNCNDEHVVVVADVNLINHAIQIRQSNCAINSNVNCTRFPEITFGNDWHVNPYYFGLFTKFAFGFAPR